MKGPVRKIMTALLAAVFLFSGAKLLIQQRENAAGSSTYQEALQLARSERKTAEEPVSLPETVIVVTVLETVLITISLQKKKRQRKNMLRRIRSRLHTAIMRRRAA